MTYFETSEAAAQWIREQAAAIGPGFHPDTDADDYLNEDGEDLFTRAEALEFNCRIEEAIELLGDDVYDLALEVIVAGGPVSNADYSRYVTR